MTSPTTEWHLAIDFGTSNSAAAHTIPMTSEVVTLPLSHRSNLMPSAIFITETGEFHTGDTALSSGRRDPVRLLLSPKRFIDHDIVQLNGQDIPFTRCLTAILRAIIDRAQSQHAGQPPTTVTLTHPEQWSVYAVDTLIDATRQAGITTENIRTISEPRAAAVHYANQQRIEPGKHVAVFDFGGGTLDIAVLQAGANGDFTVVAAKGDNSLGGRSIDNLLYRWVISQVEHDDPDFADYLRNAPISVMHSLEENIREAKEILSDTSSATITLSTPSGERDLLITRDEFNHVIEVPVARACELTQAALEQVGVDWAETPIYMTGGSSRIPHMQNRLGQIGRVMTLDDPKTVVSRGALAATLQNFTTSPSGVTTTAQPVNGNPFAAMMPTSSQVAAPSTQQEDATLKQHNAVPPLPQKTSSNKGPLLAVLGIIGVLVIGGAAVYYLMNRNSGDDSVLIAPNSQQASSSQTPQSSTAPASETAANSTNLDYIPVVDLLPGSDGYLPAKFIESAQACRVGTEFGNFGGFIDSTLATHPCNLEGTDDLSAPGTSLAKMGAFIFQDADAEDAFNQAKNLEGANIQQLQAASSSTPEVLYVRPEFGLASFFAYYPEQKILVGATASADADDNSGRAWAEYFGFIG